ncbi:MAG: pyridoxine/pyridoxamine 5'-phosphate oxidase [Pirellulaceae bacterium]|nr:MAG: pyridoxine/pyridoxamine 5'-phosphate oxidase [Pirellulaceae bacterium]
MEFHDLRRDYQGSALDIRQMLDEPISQFLLWFREALQANPADWFEPNAMTLATADREGRVSARVVLLKQVSEDGFAFFTNYESAKAQQISVNPYGALVFYWPYDARQVRVEGVIKKTEDTISDTYFHARPRESQLGAIVSPQSREIESVEELVQRAEQLKMEYADREIPRPPYWGGYVLCPKRVEFWQGRPSRLHDRVLYYLDGDRWERRRLAP